MLDKVKAALTWQMVVVLALGAVGFISIALFAPPDVRDALFGANGLLWTVVTALLKARDEEASE